MNNRMSYRDVSSIVKERFGWEGVLMLILPLIGYLLIFIIAMFAATNPSLKNLALCIFFAILIFYLTPWLRKKYFAKRGVSLDET